MVTDIAVLRLIERAPLRTIRVTQLADVATNPWRTADRLVQEGAITRLAKGIYQHRQTG